MQSSTMKLNDPDAYQVSTELDVIRRHVDLEVEQLLELGCGAAWMTRLLSKELNPRRLIATEVDEIQHRKNLDMREPPENVEFRLGGAQAVDEPDASIDAVFMFKSLHHVPAEYFQQALAEIRRVLRPGGLAYFSEPVYWGDFNALLSLFHDEKQVREQAFEALRQSVEQGLFELKAEVFFQVPGVYKDWNEFEGRFIKVTHTQHDISPALREQVKQAFHSHMGEDGAHFLKPHRVDILRKPG